MRNHGAFLKSAIALSLIAVYLLGCEVNTKELTAEYRVSTMAGYVSQYNPGHISSSEAQQIKQTDDKALLIDLRSKESYNERHVSGAINVPYEELAEYTAAELIDKEQNIIFYCFCGDKGGSAFAAYDALSELGYKNVMYTEPEDEWIYEGSYMTKPVEAKLQNRIINGIEAKEIYEAHKDVILLDVRNRDEYSEKHIEGSLLIPLVELESRLSELPDTNAIIIVYCRSGARSKLAVEVLIDAGYLNVFDLMKIDNWVV